MTSENESTFTGSERDILQGMRDEVFVIDPFTPDTLKGRCVLEAQHELKHFFFVARKRDHG